MAPIPIEKAGDQPFARSGPTDSPCSGGSDHPAEALAFVAFLATEGQRLRVAVTGEPPLSAAAAAETGWAGQGNAAARQQFMQVVGLASPGIFVPDYWDVVPPLEDAFNLIVDGETTAAAVLDEVAPRMQDSLDQNWRTWDEIGGYGGRPEEVISSLRFKSARLRANGSEPRSATSMRRRRR